MRTAELAPGTILQQMYLDDRLAEAAESPGRFIDLGAGGGQASSVLLARGWRGIGIDLNEAACATNSATNDPFVSNGSYEVRHGDFLAMSDLGKADLVVSCMVLEHLDEDATRKFFELVDSLLASSGCLILMVPGSPDHWGIEDEIAGHLRRFDERSVTEELRQHGFRTQHIAGLTYPISNWLLPLSNFLVGRSERNRLALSPAERTVLAGDRHVAFKTTYPRVLHWLLNRFTMYPFHVLQKLFRHRPTALVLYVEALPSPRPTC